MGGPIQMEDSPRVHVLVVHMNRPGGLHDFKSVRRIGDARHARKFAVRWRIVKKTLAKFGALLQRPVLIRDPIAFGNAGTARKTIIASVLDDVPGSQRAFLPDAGKIGFAIFTRHGTGLFTGPKRIGVAGFRNRVPAILRSNRRRKGKCDRGDQVDPSHCLGPLSGEPAKSFRPSGVVIWRAAKVCEPSLATNPCTAIESPGFTVSR